MTADYLQRDLIEDLRRIFDGDRFRNVKGKLVPLNVFSQFLPVVESPKPAASEDSEIETGIGTEAETENGPEAETEPGETGEDYEQEFWGEESSEEPDPDVEDGWLATSDVDNEEDPYPYAIVRVMGGEVTDAESVQVVDVLILFGACEKGFAGQGHKDVMHMIQKVYERFSKNPVLNHGYTFIVSERHPFEWTLQEEESYPYYVGGLRMSFDTVELRREDPYT